MLADFGTAKDIYCNTPWIGTLVYQAPEIPKGES